MRGIELEARIDLEEPIVASMAAARVSRAIRNYNAGVVTVVVARLNLFLSNWDWIGTNTGLSFFTSDVCSSSLQFFG